MVGNQETRAIVKVTPWNHLVSHHCCPTGHDMVACVPAAGVGLGCLELLMLLAWQLAAATSVTRMKAPCALSHWPLIWSPRVTHCSWLAHDLRHNSQRGWKRKNLVTLTAVMKVTLFPTKTYTVGNSPNRGGGSEAGKPQFDYTSHFIQRHSSESLIVLFADIFFPFKLFINILYFK